MAQSKPRDLFPGALELMVLRLVQHAPLHGYALARCIHHERSTTAIRAFRRVV
jgi:DNA-binding PadR family transcriptional regulator